MKTALFLSALAAPMIFGLAGASAREAKVDAATEALAVCAVEKNGADVAWAYVLQSGQSGLKGPALDGANAYALFAMSRNCNAGAKGFDNKRATAFSNRAFALWGGDPKKKSVSRTIDSWADCLADRETGRGRAYLFAKDFSFAGPKLIVEGVDPIENVFAPSAACDAIRPVDRAAVNMIDLYARLNYRLRAQPRLATVSSAPAATSEKK